MSKYRTPCYIVHKDKFAQNIASFRDAFSSEWGSNLSIGYSIKTNHLPWLLKYAREQGFLAEAVSDDEFKLALACGFAPNEIIFNGPQKGKKNMTIALEEGGIVNLDNFEEIESISKYLENKKLSAENRNSLTIGLRVNFNLEELCPGETTAGNSVSRFGFCVENGELQKAIESLHEMGLKISGLHMHYSTITRSSSVFKCLAQKACEVACKYNIKEEIKYIDMGGGFWGGNHSDRYPSPQQYAKQITAILKETFDPRTVNLIIEPGASILATAVDYRCKVTSVKYIRDDRIITTDGTTLHINPLQAKRKPSYFTRCASEKPFSGKQIICGNTCMENDRFCETENENIFSVGDELIFRFTGAYTIGFNSCFIHTPPRVYVSSEQEGHKMLTCIRMKNSKLMMNC